MSRAYNFKTGAPFAFEDFVVLPKIQRGYDQLPYTPELLTEDNQEIGFLYKLYLHSIATKKPYLMKFFMEERFYSRFTKFVDILSQQKLKLELNKKIDFSDCKLSRDSTDKDIKKAVNERYSDDLLKISLL